MVISRFWKALDDPSIHTVSVTECDFYRHHSHTTHIGSLLFISPYYCHSSLIDLCKFPVFPYGCFRYVIQRNMGATGVQRNSVIDYCPVMSPGCREQAFSITATADHDSPIVDFLCFQLLQKGVIGEDLDWDRMKPSLWFRLKCV